MINIDDSGWNLSISYAPGERFSFGNYRAFRNATVKDRNPLYNALEDKRKQLRDTKHEGYKGIIVCDGGCEAITKQLTDYDSYSKKQILHEFFRRTRSISFVILLWIEVEYEPGSARRLRVCGQIDTNPRARDPLPEQLVNLLKRLPEFWSQPVQSGETARLQLEGYGPRNIPPWWGQRVGGYKMGVGPSQISYRMSARELLEILSGRKTIWEFNDENGSVGSGPGGRINPFESALQRGLMIHSAKLEAVPDRDDDWIEFRISGPDPALSPFTSGRKIPE